MTAAPGGKTLADAIRAAKVKRCPKCTSDGLAAPSDFTEVAGRMVLQDSQTYRAHQWYADTGELSVSPVSVGPAKPVSSSSPSA